EVQRRELIRGASGRVAEIAVERADLQAERAARGLRMALQALRLAREVPGLAVHRDALAADHARRVRTLGVPLVRVARPYAVVVPHEEPRLDQRRTQAEILHQHAAARECEVAVALDDDALTVGQREPARLDGAVGEKRRGRRIRNEAGSWLSRR